MTSAQPYSPAGSKPLVSGEFALIEELSGLLADYESIVDKAVNESLLSENIYLRNTLANHPDWAHMSDKSSVTMTDSGVNFSVDHEDAHAIEYGDPQKNVVPTGLLRATAARRSEDLSRSMMDRVIKGLGI